jgi:hypothetical protein
MKPDDEHSRLSDNVWSINALEPNVRQAVERAMLRVSGDDDGRELVASGYANVAVREIQALYSKWTSEVRRDAEQCDLHCREYGARTGYLDALDDCLAWMSTRTTSNDDADFTPDDCRRWVTERKAAAEASRNLYVDVFYAFLLTLNEQLFL